MLNILNANSLGQSKLSNKLLSGKNQRKAIMNFEVLALRHEAPDHLPIK